MTLSSRLGLAALGLLSWGSAMVVAAVPAAPVMAALSAPQAGIGAALFATAFLPGRMARFS
jgi:hypothetical protein